MKMETEITAPSDGKVAAIVVSPGDQVPGGAVLIELEE
jgi:methylmalonyl-CoA carboxyltransferase small subunit